MKYEEIDFGEKEMVERMLQSASRDDRCGGIVGMVNGISDEEWVFEKLKVAMFDQDFWVAKTAISSIGDLARIYGNLTVELVQNLFSEINRPELKGVMEDCLEDVRIFAKE